jgi:U3 small nucleolar RNA-associated protein 23
MIISAHNLLHIALTVTLTLDKFNLGEENEKRYFVATQDKQLRNALRKIPGVPLLYINYNCIVMEKPSFVCVRKASEVLITAFQ